MLESGSWGHSVLQTPALVLSVSPDLGLHCLYPDIRSMWGYIVFAFLFVRLFIRSFVRSFVFWSQGQSFCVKVYKTSYFEDPLMDFIHIWHDGRYRSKVFISTIPTPVVTLGSRSRT